jgi:histone-lysine N-methyltransferase EZH2
VIPAYYPCHHLGNVECDENCPCAERGFCEKYCACNKILCKLKFKGCKCNSQCVSNICPCFANGRECDTDLCKSKCA